MQSMLKSLKNEGKMFNKKILFIIFLLLVSNLCYANKQVKSQFDVENSAPEIVSIKTLSGNQEKEIFVSEGGSAKIELVVKVKDTNGARNLILNGDAYFKLIKLINGSEKEYRKLGRFTPLNVKSSEGDVVKYGFVFNLDNNDNEGKYRIKVKVKDEAHIITGAHDLSFEKKGDSKTGGNQLTGHVVAGKKSSSEGFFSSIIKFFGGIFR